MSDLINRQAVIDHLRAIINATDDISGYNVGFIDGLEFCIDHLSTMPSALPDWNEMLVLCDNCGHAIHVKRTDVKPITDRKKGHWVSDENGDIKCSECGRLGVGDNYCEHCGADMREENDDIPMEYYENGGR